MRLTSIDDFRGLAIFLMFIANFIMLFSSNPPLLLSHARAEMVLPLDLVAPLFGFAMGLGLSFTRAGAVGFPGLRLLRRSVLLFAVGYLPHFFYILSVRQDFWSSAAGTWGILETWALGYLAAYIVSYIRPALRFLLVLGVVFFYQLVLLEIPAVAEHVLARPEGGPVAVFSWWLVIVTGMTCGELLAGRAAGEFRKRGAAVGLALLLLGAALHFMLVPMDRLSVSAAYIIFGSGFSALLFLLFHFCRPRRGVYFRRLGEYPLLAWIMQGIFFVPVYLTIGRGYFEWPLGGVLAVGAAVGLLLLTPLLAGRGLRLKA